MSEEDKVMKALQNQRNVGETPPPVREVGPTKRLVVRMRVVVPEAQEARVQFKDGMGNGVLIIQDYEYNLPAEKYMDPMFAMALHDEMDKLLKDTVTGSYEYIDPSIHDYQPLPLPTPDTVPAEPKSGVVSLESDIEE